MLFRSDFPVVAAQPRLADRRRILIDLLGFGYSDRPVDYGYSLEDHAAAAACVLDHLGIEGAVVIGHSMGGTIAVALALSHPALVGRLVMAEANLDPGVGGGSKIIAAFDEEIYVASGHAEFIARLQGIAGEDPILYNYLGVLALADPRAMYRSAVGLLRGTRPPQRQALARMEIPRAFIVGERSLPEYDVHALQVLGLKVLIVTQAGHAMMDENQTGFADAIAQAME